MNRLDLVEARLVALESADRTTAAGAIVYRGPWRDGEHYRPGECVTRQGSLWIAERLTTPSDIPAAADTDEDHSSGPWRLAAKRGRDGRVPADLEKRVRALEQKR